MVLYLVVLAQLGTSAQYKEMLDEAGKTYGVEFVWDRAVKDQYVQCDPLNEENLGRAVQVIKHLDEYPPSFLKAIPLQEIVLCDNLLREGNRAGGVAYRSKGMFLVVSGTSAETFHHELFHVADGASESAWSKIANFDYVGREEFFGHGRGGRSGPLDAGLEGFLTEYSKAAPAEDRAEVFQLLMTRPAEVASRAKKDETVRKKVEFIKDYVKSLDSKMNTSFWASR